MAIVNSGESSNSAFVAGLNSTNRREIISAMLGSNLWIHRQFIGLGVAAGFFLMGCSGTDGTSGPNLIAVAPCTETFTPCGGDPTGSWVFVSGCVDNDLTNAANQEIAAQYPACAGIFTSVTVSVAGSISIASGSYDQEEA